MEDISRCRLYVLPGGEDFIPVEEGHSSLAVDIHYFDWDSLCRLYGEEKVISYLKSLYGKDWVLERDHLMSFE